MRAVSLWICGNIQDYTLRLMEYINRQKNSPFVVHAYFELEKLPHKKDSSDILLIDSELYEEQESLLEFTCIILLDEGNVKKALAGYPCIFKYQPAKAVYNRLLEIYLEREHMVEPAHRVGGAYVVAVYSPAGRIGKSDFTRKFGIREGYGKRLNINLELFTRTEHSSGITDVLYYFRQQRGNLSRKIELTAESEGELDSLGGAACPWDLFDVSVDEWKDFFQQLKTEGYYDLIVADVGYLPQNPEFFRCFDKVYIPYIQEDKVLGKVTAFEAVLEFIEFGGREELFEKVKLEQNEGGVVSYELL